MTAAALQCHSSGLAMAGGLAAPFVVLLSKLSVREGQEKTKAAPRSPCLRASDSPHSDKEDGFFRPSEKLPWVR